MRFSTPRRFILFSFMAALVFGLSLANFISEITPAYAQQNPCPQMNVGGNTSLTWPAGATVKVFFDSSISPERRAIYEEALKTGAGATGKASRSTSTLSMGRPYTACP